MKVDELIEKLNEIKERGYTDIQGLLYAENGDEGIVINVQWDSNWALTKEVYE